MLLILCCDLFFKPSWVHLSILPFVVALSLHDTIRCSVFSSRTCGKDAIVGERAVPFSRPWKTVLCSDIRIQRSLSPSAPHSFIRRWKWYSLKKYARTFVLSDSVGSPAFQGAPSRMDFQACKLMKFLVSLLFFFLKIPPLISKSLFSALISKEVSEYFPEFSVWTFTN